MGAPEWFAGSSPARTSDRRRWTEPTTATVMAEAICQRRPQSRSLVVNPSQMKQRHRDRRRRHHRSTFHTMAVKFKGDRERWPTSRPSQRNNDREIVTLLADARAKSARNAFITVDEGKSLQTETGMAFEGMQFESRLPLAVLSQTDPTSNGVVLERRLRARIRKRNRQNIQRHGAMLEKSCNRQATMIIGRRRRRRSPFATPRHQTRAAWHVRRRCQ